MNQETDIKKEQKNAKFSFFKKMGIGVFLFFLIKGLVWIAIFFGLGKLIF